MQTTTASSPRPAANVNHGLADGRSVPAPADELAAVDAAWDD
ncbi:MAG: hypothetical protein ABSC94_13710 [Polyangiaceae bacterium]